MLDLRFVLAALAAVALVGCTRPAPDLPPDRSSVNSTKKISELDFQPEDLELTCGDMDRELGQIAENADRHNAEIKAHRHNNQVAGYVSSVLLFPAIIAVEHNSEEKQELDQLQSRFDELQGLKRLKSCPT